VVATATTAPLRVTRTSPPGSGFPVALSATAPAMSPLAVAGVAWTGAASNGSKSIITMAGLLIATVRTPCPVGHGYAQTV